MVSHASLKAMPCLVFPKSPCSGLLVLVMARKTNNLLGVVGQEKMKLANDEVMGWDRDRLRLTFSKFHIT